MFTALQDGWVVAYNDETLEELWRFNRRHGAEGRAGDLCDRTKAVSRGASQRPAPASREIRQLPGFQLPVRLCAELIFRRSYFGNSLQASVSEPQNSTHLA